MTMTEQNFIPKEYKISIESGKVTWESPSNIDLVQYWGKRENQITENPSISFTLNNCKTITTLSYERRELSASLKEIPDFSFEVFLDGKKKEDFAPKIEMFFKRVEVYLPFLKDFH